MKHHSLFGEFAEAFALVGWEEFSSTFRDPILEVHLLDPSYDSFEELGKTAPADEQTLFREESKRGWRNDLIIPMVKSGRNEFPDSIMIGRVEQNDVVLPHRSISKFHAFLKKDPSTGEMAITDAGSSFGTTLNGKALVKGEAAPVKSGDVVVFAEVAHGHYYSPRDFYDVMRLKLRSGKTRRLLKGGGSS